MGILKFAAKAVGTAALLATGTASAVLKTVTDTVGMELGSDILGAAKDISFEGIRSIWGDGMSETGGEMLDTYEIGSDKVSQTVSDTAHREMARTAKRAAEIARKNGDMEKYEYYMEQSERY